MSSQPVAAPADSEQVTRSHLHVLLVLGLAAAAVTAALAAITIYTTPQRVIVRVGNTSPHSIGGFTPPIGPAGHSVVVAAAPPSLPAGGPNSAAIWVHGSGLPTAPVELFAAAGVPAEIVTSAAAAFRHPLVLSWPDTDLSLAERHALVGYGRHGGTLLAVQPSATTRMALSHARGAEFAHLVLVGEGGLQSGHIRDEQVRALRRWWTATPGGFYLGSAPGGHARTVAFVHDLRTIEELRNAATFAADERDHGVRATYVVETKYLSDAAGGRLIGGDEAAAVRALRAAGADIAAGGVSGADMSTVPLGSGIEAYPSYSPAYATGVELTGATAFGELRVSRLFVQALGGGIPDVFRGIGGRTGEGFAGAAQAAGYRVDATMSATAAGGTTPFWQTEPGGGVRSLLRFPIAFQDLPRERLDQRVGALIQAVRSNQLADSPTVLAITPDSATYKLYAEDELVASLPNDVTVLSLDQLGSFFRARRTLAVDARPAQHRGGWIVRLHAPGAVSGQTLVAPFAIAYASTADGRGLQVFDSHRIALPSFAGDLVVQVAPGR